MDNQLAKHCKAEVHTVVAIFLIATTQFSYCCVNSGLLSLQTSVMSSGAMGSTGLSMNVLSGIYLHGSPVNKIIKETCGNVASFHVSAYFTVHTPHFLMIPLDVNISFHPV
jgi:hypothetical protein